MSTFHTQLSKVYTSKYSEYLFYTKYHEVAEVFVRKYEDFLFTSAIYKNQRSIGDIVRQIYKEQKSSINSSIFSSLSAPLKESAEVEQQVYSFPAIGLPTQPTPLS